MRLVGGTNVGEGRVEYCLGGAWGSVCHYSWGASDAQVVCRQLGYPTDGEGIDLDQGQLFFKYLLL